MIANFFRRTLPDRIFYIGLLMLLYYSLAVYYKGAMFFTEASFWEKSAYLFFLIPYLFASELIIKASGLTLDNLYATLLTAVLFGTFYPIMFHGNLLLLYGLLLGAYHTIYSYDGGGKAGKKLFDAGLLLGFASCLYSWSSLFLLLVYVALIVHRRKPDKNYLIPLIGFSVPLFLLFTYYFCTDAMAVFYTKFSLPFSGDFSVYQSAELLVPLSYLSFLIVLAVIVATPRIIVISNRLKKAWKILIFHLLLGLVLVLVAPQKDGSELLFLVFPGAIIIANFLPKVRLPKVADAILYLFLIMSAGVYCYCFVP
ncbi:MAG: hypothetical protein QGH06_05555 [Lutibacter sp.]|jgi:hypothetical protein|nr:hypothetical protein [Lutibacter sp.]